MELTDTIKIERVIEVLALALDNDTEEHRLIYLMNKLNSARLINLNLDNENEAMRKRMADIIEVRS